MAQVPHLAIAIEAELDGGGRVVSADPHIMRMHKRNGGVDGGVLAIPGILALARLAWRTGANIERSAIVVDGETDVELWIRAIRADNLIKLSISGWQEVATRNIRQSSHPTAMSSLGEPAADVPSLLLDAKLTIIAVEPALGRWIDATSAGLTIDTLFTTATEQSWADEFDEYESAFAVTHIMSQTSFRLRYRQVAHSGAIIGYACELEIGPEAQVDDRPEKTTSMDDRPRFGKQFASAVRQPLGRIIANAETISSHVNGPIKENYAGYANDIASAARHLSELVSDLEDLDAIDRTDFHVAAEKVELNDIVRRVSGLLALKAADHRITLDVPPIDQNIEVTGEFRRVLQIVLNLTGNAIRYSPDGSTIRITFSSDPPSLSISDEGAGIAVDDRERIFEKFERLGRSADGGSGLGLYISRRLARAMKGELSISETAEGGAVFTLRLPPWIGN